MGVAVALALVAESSPLAARRKKRGGKGRGGKGGGRDYDCADFATQKEAQRFFKKNGGPAEDPHRLDSDNDGIACEHLP
jgi:hypothetical protein